MIMKLRKLVSEDIQQNPDEVAPMTSDEKKSFMEAVSKYNQFGKEIHRDSNLREVAKKLAEIAEIAHRCTIAETEESFDKITVNRNMKDLKALSGNFGKVAQEAQSLQERLSSLYEDMGYILNRYYDINDEAPVGPEVKSTETDKDITEATEKVKDGAHVMIKPDENEKRITYGTVLDKPYNGLVTIELDKKFRVGAHDDGLREVPIGLIRHQYSSGHSFGK